MFDIAYYIPIILALGAPMIVYLVLGPKSVITRFAFTGTCILFSARYVYWRFTYSMPHDQWLIQQIWAWVFFFFEAGTLLSSMTVYMFMSRRIDRTSIVNARANSPLLNSPVDVFIATYNEGYEILERTLVGATSIDHDDLRVWVLDDGSRPWVEELAKEFGAHYCKRFKGKHAKAGNVNNGLTHALSIGRKPKFILLFDADFIANKKILKRVLPLFEEDDVGIVQTPQHFFNPDPVQSNLLCANAWPDEQRFFFNELLPCKDAWGAAFCCGTSAVFRVEAFEKCNGMATETVTEDMLTTFRMLEHGYRTILLDEPLSLGLAPEGLKDYIGQRSRWCLGAIQQIYTRWSFFGAAKIGFINRVSCFDGISYWSLTYPFKIMMISAPLVYWWTGTAVIVSTVDDMIYWLAPYLISSMMFMYLFANNKVFPILTDVSHLLCSFSISRTVFTTLFKPYGHPFKVTAKGVSTNGIVVQWNILLPFLVMGAGTLLGIMYNMQSYSSLAGTAGYGINVFWSLFNMMVLTIACMVCVEFPKMRRFERFLSGENATLEINGCIVNCVVLDISLGGAKVLLREANFRSVQEGLKIKVNIYDTKIPAKITRFINTETEVAIEFEIDTAMRRFLIAKLFTGNYNNEIGRVSVWGSIKGIVRKTFY